MLGAMARLFLVWGTWGSPVLESGCTPVLGIALGRWALVRTYLGVLVVGCPAGLSMMTGRAWSSNRQASVTGELHSPQGPFLVLLPGHFWV